jgi:thiol-disulfide isomerase/thioredoxin
MLKLLFLIVFCSSLGVHLDAQVVQTSSFEKLKQRISAQNDTTYIIHFFASWCAPCLKEIPELNAFSEEYKEAPVKVVFVSLDLVSTCQETLPKLIEKYAITQEVVVLDEGNSSRWIDEVNPQWSGAIPATLVVNTTKKHTKFRADTITKKELIQLMP